MAQAHVTAMVAALSVGAPEGHVTTLGDFSIVESEVLALPESAVLDPEDDYCPLSDIPDAATTCGIHRIGSKIYVVGDNGLPPYGCLFMFRLTARV